MFMPCFDFKYTEASYKLCDVTLHFSFMIINIFRIKQYLKFNTLTIQYNYEIFEKLTVFIFCYFIYSSKF